MILTGVGFRLVSERVAKVRAVEEDMADVVRSQRLSAWARSGDALQRARIRLGDGGPVELRRRLDQAGHDQELVARLDMVRLKRAGRVDGTIGYGERDYEQAFHEAGLCQIDDDPDVVAGRVRASNVRVALVAALDDWALCVGRGTDEDRVAWLLAVAKKADPDPRGWRDCFRDPITRRNREELLRLAESANVAETPVNLLMALAELVQKQGGDAIPFLRQVQKQHPNDFWANHELGFALNESQPADAVRFYQAALAIRPETPGLLNNLAGVLARMGLMEEAAYYFQKAVRLDPNKALYRASYGLCLMNLNRDREANEQFQQGLTLQPDIETLRRLQNGLRLVLLRQGRSNEAYQAWRKLLETDPPDHQAWDGYVELCLFLGHEVEYRRARRALLDRFSAAENPNIAERTGRACLLLTPSSDELQTATALIDRALAKDKAKPVGHYAYFLFARGLADYRAGRFVSAVSIMEGAARPVLGPAPRLVLAMCQHRLGQKKEASATLAAAIGAFDWSVARAGGPEAWIYHVLHREAEAMIVPNQAGFLLEIDRLTR